MRSNSIDQLDFSSKFSAKLPSLKKLRSQSMGRSLVFAWLKSFTVGRLTLIDNSAEGDEKIQHFGQSQADATLNATITINDQSCYWDIINKGTLGAGESYMQGHWSADNLTLVVQLMVSNMDAINSLDKGQNIFQKMVLCNNADVMSTNVFSAKTPNYRCGSQVGFARIYFFVEPELSTRPIPRSLEPGFYFSSPSLCTAHHQAKRIYQNGSFAQKNPAKANKKVGVW